MNNPSNTSQVKIILVNKTDSKGGAAIACNRLLKALDSHLLEAKLLVQEKYIIDELIETTTNSSYKKFSNFFNFAFEKFLFLFHERSKDIRFAFSVANTGEDISKNKTLKEADIIHLHWINAGFLSLDSLKKIFKTKKPIIWTLHDMWAFTGGCHYSLNCTGYKSTCSHCPFLRKPSGKDLSNRHFNNKIDIYSEAKNLTFVTCSNWLGNIARESMMLKDFRIETIPNPININIFKPTDKAIARHNLQLPSDKILILFGAANVLDKRKGLKYFSGAMNFLSENHPELKDKIELVVFGKKSAANEMLDLPFKVNSLSVISSEEKLAELYNAVDLFVLPSMEDNLPNTIMESFSCGTPAVGFKIGSIPEMIDHKQNGYIAKYKSTEDLAEGIYWATCIADKTALSENARKKVMENYSPEIIAKKYKQLYNEILTN